MHLNDLAESGGEWLRGTGPESDGARAADAPLHIARQHGQGTGDDLPYGG